MNKRTARALAWRLNHDEVSERVKGGHPPFAAGVHINEPISYGNELRWHDAGLIQPGLGTNERTRWALTHEAALALNRLADRGELNAPDMMTTIRFARQRTLF